MAEGVSEPPLFVPCHPTPVGGVKGQEPQMWSLHPDMFRHSLCPQHPRTSQGVSLDSLGVDAVKIGHICTPDHRRRRQEAPKRILGDAGGVFSFSGRIPLARGPLESPLFVPHSALSLEGLKGQDIRGWFLTTCVFGHFLCLLCDGVDMGAQGSDRRDGCRRGSDRNVLPCPSVLAGARDRVKAERN